MLNEELLWKYLNKECSEEEYAEILDWVNQSEDNKHKLFRMEEMWSMGKYVQYSQTKYLNKARHRFDKKIKAKGAVSQKRKMLFNTMKYAAISVFVLGGALLAMNYLKPSEPDAEWIVLSSDKNVKECLLPDGTTVWLNKNTTLKYKFASAKQNTYEIFLEGEGFFDVPKNKQRQFIVNTDLMKIKVLGTEFNVKALPNSGLEETSLVDGRILVEGKSNDCYILSPGERAIVDKNSSKIVVESVNVKLEGFWREGMFPFESASIYDIAETLEQHYNVKIFISPNVDASNTYSGVLKQKDSIETVLSSLKNAIRISYKIKDQRVYIDNAGVY